MQVALLDEIGKRLLEFQPNVKAEPALDATEARDEFSSSSTGGVGQADAEAPREQCFVFSTRTRTVPNDSTCTRLVGGCNVPPV